jgi:para-aminobenzoate synthetase component 1
MKEICYFNRNDGSGLLGFGLDCSIRISETPSLDSLQRFIDENQSKYIFGALNYNLKNEINNLESSIADTLNFPSVLFWVPKYVVKIQNEHFDFVQGEKNEESFTFLNYFLEEETDLNFHQYNDRIKPRLSKLEYIDKIKKIKSHLQRGDVYEVNFCQEYFADNIEIPFELDLYFKLNQIAKAPFSSYLKFDEFTLFCNSPERFIEFKNGKLTTQPMKGTAARNKDEEIDFYSKKELENNPKERSENIMIVDLVRNDLSRIAKKGTVKVSELCGIHTFETVHQMISTVECEVEEDKVRIVYPPITAGMNIRPKGSQTQKGSLILPANTKITPGIIGFLAGFGLEKISVFPFPKVGILITGDELVPPGKTPEFGKIYESNGTALSALLAEIRINPVFVKKVPDAPEKCKPKDSSRPETLRCVLVDKIRGDAYIKELSAILAACAN